MAYSDEILSAMEILIKSSKKQDDYLEGYVLKDNKNGTYDVKINGEIFNLKARSGLEVTKNKIYIIHLLNGDFSTKYIYDKRDNIL